MREYMKRKRLKGKSVIFESEASKVGEDLSLVKPRGGVVVIESGMEGKIEIDPAQLNQGKSIIGEEYRESSESSKELVNGSAGELCGGQENGGADEVKA
jgi:hypothetical protein